MRCCDCWKRGGLTLIEVVAAMALVATLLVTTLAAFTRNAGQIRRAELHRQAVDATDVLVAEWFATGEFPRGREEVFVAEPRLRWRTSTRPAGISQDWRAEVLVVEVFENAIEPGGRVNREGDPVLVIELLVEEEMARKDAKNAEES